MSTHLTRSQLDDWLAGTLAEPARAALLDHLDTCEECAALLDDDTLARLLEAEDAPPVTPPPLRLPSARRGSNTQRFLGFALAVAAVAFFAVATRPPRDELVEKGRATAPAVHLTLALTHGGVAGARLHEGDRVGPDAVVVAEIETDGPGARYLFAVDGAGRRHVLMPPEGQSAVVEAAGARPATWEGDWLALALDDVPGPVTLVAGVTAGPLPLATVMSEWPDGTAGTRFDAVRLEVGP